MATLKGPGEAQSHDGSALRIGIVHARWNTSIIEPLVTGALKSLAAAGVQRQNTVVQSVPGSWELPIAVQRLYAASQIQSAATSSTTLGGAVGDLLGASTTDLTSLPTSTTPSSTSSTSPFDAIIAIGCLIKGETMHFEYIAETTSQGLMRVQLDSGVPIVFGLLTVLTEEQALARAGVSGKGHNHGEDWGSAAVELGVKRRAWAEGRIE
ncbi:MAG: hypothetical protein M1827_000813 [Pycnora praestabilis]|nr:MAG: hypothetical protein M1827_000813 [Pycnora praestabilis]